MSTDAISYSWGCHEGLWDRQCHEINSRFEQRPLREHLNAALGCTSLDRGPCVHSSCLGASQTGTEQGDTAGLRCVPASGGGSSRSERHYDSCTAHTFVFHLSQLLSDLFKQLTKKQMSFLTGITSAHSNVSTILDTFCMCCVSHWWPHAKISTGLCATRFSARFPNWKVCPEKAAVP